MVKWCFCISIMIVTCVPTPPPPPYHGSILRMHSFIRSDIIRIHSSLSTTRFSKHSCDSFSGTMCAAQCIRGAFAVHSRCICGVLVVRLCYKLRCSCGPLRCDSFCSVVWYNAAEYCCPLVGWTRESGRVGSGRVTILSDFGGRVSTEDFVVFVLIISWYQNRYQSTNQSKNIYCFEPKNKWIQKYNYQWIFEYYTFGFIDFHDI